MWCGKHRHQWQGFIVRSADRGKTPATIRARQRTHLGHRGRHVVGHGSRYRCAQVDWQGRIISRLCTDARITRHGGVAASLECFEVGLGGKAFQVGLVKGELDTRHVGTKAAELRIQRRHLLTEVARLVPDVRLDSGDLLAEVARLGVDTRLDCGDLLAEVARLVLDVRLDCGDLLGKVACLWA